MGWKLGVLGLAALLAVGVTALFLALPREEVRAGTASESGKSRESDLLACIQSSAALNTKLLALESLRRLDGSTDTLAALARGPDLALAAFSASALARQGTAEAKAALRDLVADDRLGTEIRRAAMSALSARWTAAADRAWLADQVAGEAALSAHAAWLASRAGK